MLLNANSIESFIRLNGPHGKKAQVGIDLSIRNITQITGGAILRTEAKIDNYKELQIEVFDEGDKMAKGWRLMPGVYSLTFNESVKLDTKHTAFVRHRSSVLRCGSIITSGVFDPGFECDFIGATMFVFNQIDIEINSRLAQLLIMESEETTPYNGNYQGDKDKK